MNPHADESLKLAALGHDLERTLGRESIDKKKFKYIKDYRVAHSNTSAKLMEQLLMKYEYPDALTARVKRLIRLHEFGGVGDAQILCDADILSFFSYYLPIYLRKNSKQKAKQKIKEKLTYLSDEGKKLLVLYGLNKYKLNQK